jgi:hypothetical protein
VLQPVRPAMPGRLGDRLAVVIVQLHQQPVTIWPQRCRVSRRGKHPAVRPGRSASSADRASSASVVLRVVHGEHGGVAVVEHVLMLKSPARWSRAGLGVQSVAGMLSLSR